MARFTDKVIIVTGAASGIGEAAARRFAAEGVTLVPSLVTVLAPPGNRGAPMQPNSPHARDAASLIHKQIDLERKI